MIWTLILVLVGHPIITLEGFKSRDLCELAAASVRLNIDRTAKYTCIWKGSE